MSETDRLQRRLESAANIAIIVVALLAAGVAARAFFGRRAHPDAHIPAGSRMRSLDIDWSKHDRTLVLALQESCSYCSAGASFYRRLATEARGNDRLGLVAVVPRDGAERRYLAEIGLDSAEVRQADLPALGLKATPTLALIDRNGVVLASWVGKLSPQWESEVLAAWAGTARTAMNERR